MYEVLVSGLETTGHHGVTEEERNKGCRLKFSVTATVSGSADETDHIYDTVDYGALAGLVVEVSEGARYRTLERLARVLAERAFVRIPLIEAIEVRIDKLDPPVPHSVESLGVRYCASRSD